MEVKLRIFKSIIFGPSLLGHSVFDTFFGIVKKRASASVNSIEDETFEGSGELQKRAVLETIGVGVGGSATGVGLLCSFLP